MKLKTKCLLGTHLSIAGGVEKSIDRAIALQCNVLQIFLQNPRTWNSPALSEENINLFLARKKETGMIVAGHCNYLINPVSLNMDVRKKSYHLLVRELQNADKLNVPYYIIHPGAGAGIEVSEATTLFADIIDRAMEESENAMTTLLLETTAGKRLGSRFEHLRDIIDKSKLKDRIGVCIDTAHIFASGYDLRSLKTIQLTINDFNHVIGIEKLRFFHLNDSKKGFNSGVDRHEHIGQGEIGIKAFTSIMNKKEFHSIPKCIETPKNEKLKWDEMNLSTLRKLIK